MRALPIGLVVYSIDEKIYLDRQNILTLVFFLLIGLFLSVMSEKKRQLVQVVVLFTIKIL